MVTKNDLVILLTDMQSNGAEVSDYLKKAIISRDVPLDVVKFINDSRNLSVASFYEMLRKKNNEKKSDLYKNIVKEITDPFEIITTLSAFSLQIILFAKKLKDKEKVMFYKHSRAEEVTRVLNNYYKSLDITEALKVLRLIKIDLKVLESIR